MTAVTGAANMTRCRVATAQKNPRRLCLQLGETSPRHEGWPRAPMAPCPT